jgi:hypothetical protein
MDTDKTTDKPTIDLKQDIEATRAGMTATIAALEQKLNPADLREKAVNELHHVEDRVKEAVKEQLHEASLALRQELAIARESVATDLKTAFQNAKQSMRDATLGRVEDMATRAGDVMNDTRDSLLQTIRNNPLPAALTGIGIMWLLMNRSNAAADRSRRRSFDEGGGRAVDGPRHAAGHLVDQVGSAVESASSAVGALAHRASDTASSALHTATDVAGHLAGQTSEAAGQIVHQASEAAGHLAEQAQQVAGQVASGARSSARRVEHALKDTLHERPMVLGAVALAAGAAVGLSLPRSDREDALMGEARDQLLHKAQEVTGEAAHAVQELTTKTAETAKNALKEAAQS